jgi:hypothetical protein
MRACVPRGPTLRPRAPGQAAAFTPRLAEIRLLARALRTRCTRASANIASMNSIDNGSVTNALACAAELRPLGLSDSLELLLLLRDNAPERYVRAAFRWHARYVSEARGVTLEEGQALLATLVALAGERKRNAAFALPELLSRRGFERSCEVLVAWSRAS